MTPPSSSDPVACSLFEKDYHFGLGALVNSLHRHGYRGIFHAGVRGPLPPWAQPLIIGDGFQDFQAADGLVIRFHTLGVNEHLTYYKPTFLRSVLVEHAPQASAAFYFDPDIVVKSPWSFFSRWVEGKIAFCEDLNWRFHRSHPIRREWARVMQPHGMVPSGTQDVYFNAGFVGLSRNCLDFVEKWLTILKIISPLVEGFQQITLADRSFAFHKGDQDAMNMAADFFPECISSIGPEGMDFIHGGYTMSHAVGDAKPWRKQFIQSALSGVPPSFADKGFLENCVGAIPLYPDQTLSWKKLDLKIGSAIGRFIRRQ